MKTILLPLTCEIKQIPAATVFRKAALFYRKIIFGNPDVNLQEFLFYFIANQTKSYILLLSKVIAQLSSTKQMI